MTLDTIYGSKKAVRMMFPAYVATMMASAVTVKSPANELLLLLLIAAN